jgi:hypothetical protein
MNVLWLTSPFKKDDISTNKDTIWVFTDNESKKGGGEMKEWMRSSDNCHAIITRETIGSNGYFKEDNISKTTRVIRDSFHALQLKIRQGKLIILPSIEIDEALIELEKNAPTLALIFSKCIDTINKYRMTTLV